MVGAIELAVAQPSADAVVRHRLIREECVPWMVALAHRRYPNNFDIQSAEMWFRNIVLKQPMVFCPIRTDHAFCVAMVSANPWLPAELHSHIAMVCAEDGKMWDAMLLLRESLAWAKRRGCVDWRLGSETLFELAPMAKRVGAVEDTGTWKVRL